MSNFIENRKARGLLAYVDNKPAGWCNAAPRTTLAGLNRFRQFQVDDPDKVGSIVDFLIVKPYRGQGIAKRLLETACEKFREQDSPTPKHTLQRQREPKQAIFLGLSPCTLKLASNPTEKGSGT